MIPQHIVNQIIEVANIEEVVSDFVALKRRGANLLGHCPFHNEKTPSFTVSPSKGIFKCFGCGVSGNAVGFVMEHEKYTFPEALRYLAKKYHIEIVEEEKSEEYYAEKTLKEALYGVTEFAANYFNEQMLKTDEGKSIGEAYVRERGINDESIKKFMIGYSPMESDAFTKHAIAKGYSKDILEKSGLTITNERGSYDRFRGRVVFTIHSQIGKVVGFGARYLGTDKNKPKYVNSPETDIYNKSNVLFGLFQAKSAISSADSCYLVEGYTDVISLVQSGIHNVVASSGTSLTVEQIRLIKRYTNNITVLFDGDEAGIKASFRGIDMILEQGMNVKTLLFPDGQDPDTFARSRRSSEVQEYLENNAKDFIIFKIELLLKDVKDDPVKRVSLMKDFIQSISLIPDKLTRLAYTREASRLMQMDESVIISEMNKIIRNKIIKKSSQEAANQGDDLLVEQYVPIPIEDKQVSLLDSSVQEKEIIRQLVLFGNEKIKLYVEVEGEKEHKEVEIKVAQYIINDLENDEIKFSNPSYQSVYECCRDIYKENNELDVKQLINSQDKNVQNVVIELLAIERNLSENWEKHLISLSTEDQVLDTLIPRTLLSFKSKYVRQMMDEIVEKLKVAEDEIEIFQLQKEYVKLKEFIDNISFNVLNRTILY